MILLTGATGTIGRALATQLVDAGAGVRAMTRDPEKARPLLPRSVEIVHADFTDPASLGRALAGIESLFLLTSPGPSIHAHDEATVQLARDTRIRRIVKMSAFGAGAPSPLKAGAWHVPGERAIASSGVAYTFLRPTAFASNALQWASAIRTGESVDVATAKGKHAVIDPRDVAAVAADALTSNAHEGKAYTLTGPEAVDTHEQLRIIGRALGRDVHGRDVDLETLQRRARDAGVPEAFVAAMVEGLAFVRDDKASETTDAVERILGRPPRSFAEWVRDNLSAFA
ncbi:MAG: SDR family oxidoreductase [Polyangiaceae bacterium]|nr:SDR family oxidoreductase [Polyangiaceae bacterium]